MDINGLEIDFDLDNRKDNARFVKALTALQKKQERGQINDDDMEAFLNGCIKPEQVKELLKDGRISTLSKVFTQLFSNTVDQYGDVSRVYADTAEIFVTMKARVGEISEDYKEISNKIQST